MCTPLIIAGLALTAGSVVANSVADGQVRGARDEVLTAESTRQRGFDAQTAAKNEDSRERFVNFVPQQEAEAAQLRDQFKTEVATDPNTSIMPQSSSNIVNQESAKQNNIAQMFVDDQAGARADMRSFGQLLGDKSLLQSRDAGAIAQIGGFKRGSQSITPYELDEANRAGDGLKFFADILRAGGSVTTGAGIGGGGSLADMFGGVAPPVPAPYPAFRPLNLMG